MTAPATVVAVKDFKPEVHPDWCPGCGDFGVLTSLYQACAQLQIQPHELMVVSGIGCSSNLPGFIRSYGAHTLHGRLLPFATGCKLANQNMTVIGTGGDGDGYGIGLNHFIQAMRRNIDVTYIVMNNEIYGLTTGQVSPTSETGMKTKTSPFGNLEGMLNPMALALAAGCGFVARGFSGQPKHLVELYKAGIQHKGFALIDVFSPCVTFNKLNTYQYFRDRIYKLEDDEHDTSSFHAAMDKALEWDPKIPIGLFYQNPDPQPSLDTLDPALTTGVPLAHQNYMIDAETRGELIREFM
jgi:2-oxoglutarate ferredoxin oxidoreductase subunit beta